MLPLFFNEGVRTNASMLHLTGTPESEESKAIYLRCV